MEKLNPPSPMQLVGNLAYNWKRFKQKFNIYLAASGAGGDDEKIKASIFLHVIDQVCHVTHGVHVNKDEMQEAMLLSHFNDKEIHYLMILAANWAYLKGACQQTHAYQDINTRDDQELQDVQSHSKEGLNSYS